MQRKLVIRSARWVFQVRVQHIFNENAMQARTPASNPLPKAIRASHGPRVSKENQGKSKRLSKGTKSENKGSKGAKASCKGISGLENSKSETCGNSGISANGTRLHHRHVDSRGVLTNGTTAGVCVEWNDWSCVGWHEDCEQTHDTSVSSFSLESSEWVKMNLDTGAVNTFPSELWSRRNRR